MEDLKALTEFPECTWDYIDRLRMALASACKERDEARKELHESKSELAAMRNELCYLCGKYEHGAMQGLCLLEQCKRNEDSGSLLPLSAGKRKDEAKRRRKVPWEEGSGDVFRKAHEGGNEMK